MVYEPFNISGTGKEPIFKTKHDNNSYESLQL